MQTTTIYERVHRARKVALLVDAAKKARPSLTASQLNEYWRQSATGIEFERLVKVAGIKAPSGRTVLAFFDALADAAREERS